MENEKLFVVDKVFSRIWDGKEYIATIRFNTKGDKYQVTPKVKDCLVPEINLTIPLGVLKSQEKFSKIKTYFFWDLFVTLEIQNTGIESKVPVESSVEYNEIIQEDDVFIYSNTVGNVFFKIIFGKTQNMNKPKRKMGLNNKFFKFEIEL